MQDLALALGFWLVYEAISLPLRWALTPLPVSADLRRLMSRVAGPAILALAAGLAAHGPIRLGPISGWALVLLAGGAAGFFGCAVMGRRFFPLAVATSLPIERRRWRRDLVVESVALASFLGYVAFRRLAPEMTFEIQNSGAEKFPNAMLFWSCWHAAQLPPDDYWFSGLTQTYYYWGHFFWSWIGRLGGFPASAVIALGLARVVGLTVEASYLMLRAMKVSWRGAILGAVVIAWGGNPQAWVTLKSQFDAHRQAVAMEESPEQERAFDLIPKGTGEVLGDWQWQHYSFWEPSRVMAGTVTEFPAWSAILGDFHAHHLALPWLMGWFALMLGGDRWFLRGGSVLSRPSRLILVAGMGGGLGAAACLANRWFLPVVFAGGAVLLFWRRNGAAWKDGFVILGTLGGLLGLAFVLGGDHPLAPLSPGRGAAESSSLMGRLPVKLLPSSLRSTPQEILGLWGFQLAVLVPGTFVGLFQRRRSGWALGWGLAGVLLIGAGVFLFSGAMVGRREPALLWLGLGCWIIALSGAARPWMPRRAGLAGVGACVLLAGLEFFYIQDRMTGDLARYNSYFKFSYAAWPALSATAWVAAVKLWTLPRAGGGRWIIRVLLAFLIPGVMAMWVFGGPARVLQARVGDDAERVPTLNAFAWLDSREAYQADAAALAWIRENVPPGDVVAEAPTQAGYSYQGRVASLAGRPVALGWGHHEAQWRGVAIYDRLSARHEAVNRLFLAGDAEAMREAARVLHVQWAIMGKYERETYGESAFQESLEMMREAAMLRKAFPSREPRTFLFEF